VVVKSLPCFTAPPTFDTVYFGGGTPSLLKPDEVASVLGALSLAPNAEVTFEVNPTDAINLPELRAAGVNRIRSHVGAWLSFVS
jgi:coproporphyrinogen III oxidase-like Fe-S oxidoreductase